jgi:hypothetical protein
MGDTVVRPGDGLSRNNGHSDIAFAPGTLIGETERIAVSGCAQRTAGWAEVDPFSLWRTAGP